MLKQRIEIDGITMAYCDVGSGDPIVFLHGNPTSSYLWRNVIPHLSDGYRCVAPDLVGMGDSDKLPESDANAYRFVQHRGFLDQLLESLDLGDRVTFVLHDWGGGLGFDWANRHRDRVAGIAYMETIVRELDWAEWPEQAKGIFSAFRSDAGEELILDKNVFVERVLPASMIRDLDEAEMYEYRRPFLEPGESRRPTLTWPREIPLDGAPRDVAEIVRSYSEWLTESSIPKLFVNADPGSILTGQQREFCRSWPNQTEVTVAGIHFIQEDSPLDIGVAIRGWRDALG